MNKPVVFLASMTFGLCASIAQTAPAPGLGSAQVGSAATTRHGRVEAVLAGPDGGVRALFLGGGTAVALSPQLSGQLASLPLKGRAVTVSGPAQTLAGSVTIQALTLRIGSNTFIASPQPGAEAPLPGRPRDPRQFAGLNGRPGPGAPPPGRGPLPPPPGAAGHGPAPAPPPGPTAANVPPPPPDSRNQDAPPPPAPSLAPGVPAAPGSGSQPPAPQQ